MLELPLENSTFMKAVLALFFTIFLSVSEASDCGVLLNSFMKLDPQKNTASLENFIFTEEQFCDLGTKELNANFKIDLYNQTNQLINSKSIFLNTLTIIEPLKAKSLEFKKNKVVRNAQFRTVKFSITLPKESVASYKIVSISDGKTIGEGVVK